jgi:gamma-glutamyltranspeptidase/glutathione hydrolase
MFQVGVDQPPTVNYKGIDVYTCGTWCQGPVTLQTLKILEGIDLRTMGHNSVDYLHTVIEALKLAYADRDAFYGDPDFVEVPMAGLLDSDYGSGRLGLIDARKAYPGMPPHGDPWSFQSGERPEARYRQPVPVAGAMEPDTSYICTVDRWGNAFSATPSDGIGGSPVMPGLGFVVSARGSQSWLDPDHPAALAPGKRPRLTPNPAMAFKDGKLWMPFGTPAGDVQCQSMVQMFLNMVEFDMDVQQAVEAPRVSTWSFPNSFFPHAYYPGLVGAEGRIDSETLDGLRERGHDVEVWNDWTPRMGALCGIEIDRERGALFAGADLRRDGYAMGR